jgi:hypothetical protein
VEADGLSYNQRKAISGRYGWSHRGFLGKLARVYPFDLLKDVPPDMMHLTMNLIKGEHLMRRIGSDCDTDLAHTTADVLGGWTGKPDTNPCHVNNWSGGMFIDHLLYGFRRNINPSFSRGRRFARDLSHAAIMAWSAEECLIFLRLEWRWFMQQFRDSWELAGLPIPAVFQVLEDAWTLLEKLFVPLLDRRGCQQTPLQVKHNAYAYVLHLAKATTSGQQAFCLGLHTYTLHSTLHLWQHLEWWGNSFEMWCFKYERMASELTQMLTGWNGRGEPGGFIARKMALKQASSMHMTSILERCLSQNMF